MLEWTLHPHFNLEADTKIIRKAFKNQLPEFVKRVKQLEKCEALDVYEAVHQLFATCANEMMQPSSRM